VAAKVPEGPMWVHEINHDGYRMIVIRDQDRVRLVSRSDYNWARQCSRRTDIF
jgi:bifunctional non-homologous end joining protein LigD